ncbi:hypothetical protein DPMN_040756 [Dreissena polymorpha]|uniref:Uncharacterized protein n=1 Tax=Dreissena polymorpha TaxID=45954 RepID=A0A9D4HVC3_DREPO|nr:hypothetical protein DPMN_040756 [Dreissena polymorpha]
MELKCSKKCDEMAAKMHDHIHSLDVQAQLKGRINIDIAPDEDLIKMSVLQQIEKLMVEEVKDFEKREQIVAKARDQIRMDINQKYHILIEKLVEVEKSIENTKSEGITMLSHGHIFIKWSTYEVAVVSLIWCRLSDQKIPYEGVS